MKCPRCGEMFFDASDEYALETCDRCTDDDDETECGSCRRCGHFSKHGKPSIDKRDRKCLDCGGTGLTTRTGKGE